MKVIQTLFSISLIAACISMPADGREIAVRTPAGEEFMVEVQPNDTFDEVIKYIENYLSMLENEDFDSNAGDWVLKDSKRDFLLDFMMASTCNFSIQKSNTGTVRNYDAPLSPEQIKDIHYLVSTLGNSSLIKITSHRSDLEKAGARIDKIHPLKFLSCVFVDEELKASIANMQGRYWVWKKFVQGLSGSFDEEAKNDNMRAECVQDFANTLGIDISLINASIQDRQWGQLIDTLIKSIPRQGNTDRYNM